MARYTPGITPPKNPKPADPPRPVDKSTPQNAARDRALAAQDKRQKAAAQREKEIADKAGLTTMAGGIGPGIDQQPPPPPPPPPPEPEPEPPPPPPPVDPRPGIDNR